MSKPEGSMALTLEAWSQGFMMGALIIMTGITAANMRKGVLLHKLIMVELLIAWPDCFFIFLSPPSFGWYLSSSSTLIISSWQVHNVVAWIKNKPFLSRNLSLLYIGTIVLAQGYWITEIYANFTYFNGINPHLFPKTRPYEALCRDPWWIFTVVNLFWNIKKRYEFGYLEIITTSHRFGILLFSMCLSIIFIVVDILAVTSTLHIGGLNPFWKLAFVFKCFTDTIVLDDFKTALDKLSRFRRDKIRKGSAFSEHQGSVLGEDVSRRRSTHQLSEEPMKEVAHVSHDEEKGPSSPTLARSPQRVDSVAEPGSPLDTNIRKFRGSKDWWDREDLD